jgi:hypothetical protein
MKTKHTPLRLGLVLGCGAMVALAVSCSEESSTGVSNPGFAATTTGPFQFEPLAASAVCTAGGSPTEPLVLPAGYTQQVIASEPDFQTDIDMNTQNETGPQSGRFLYRPSEATTNGSVSVTDLLTGATNIIAQRSDWERLDPSVWTTWGTILIGEETNAAALRDPTLPQAVGGLVYELFIDQANPTAPLGPQAIVPRPAIGAKAHEGMRFDALGNLYSISEANPGFIFKFTPDRRGDLSSGQLYALKVVTPTGDRTGEATWVPLDRDAVQVDANAAAAAAGATGYNRPEDVELASSTGSNQGGSNILYVDVTGASGPADNRVLGVDLREADGGSEHATAFVYDYVKIGVNAPADFEMPDNLALDHAGNLYITEDPGGSFATGKRKGDDIWVATPSNGGQHEPASSVVRFATLTDCDAEPTGIYFEHTGGRFFVNVQHRGGDGLDKAMAVLRP